MIQIYFLKHSESRKTFGGTKCEQKIGENLIRITRIKIWMVASNFESGLKLTERGLN